MKPGETVNARKYVEVLESTVEAVCAKKVSEEHSGAAVLDEKIVMQ